ncbi:transcription elongation factor GreB [Taylorella equigenitalis]|uniref:Transcription elongation factor GreB n=2 Tax=Taylorella equigenitalis TaxID=29575 RepID=A0A654KII6_TAYEM|nr:transcription elongation factor GreB [Taylorella equigenitalis]ADU92179.1 Transcription elongation factor GreB [Taylorella equigenitalis MCE9]AFN35738.1 transcription elongation factor [Taylorella equigenitalis ATCC 35865]ASY39156.1 transcription elongation factor GreB [Taylorella equigenitalis]ASY40674.1 transcription elongation factor GreB [Taylorella equigenitalis]WDU56934.1 transcription elongation factor GreB [Taylorella equigenitalis]
MSRAFVKEDAKKEEELNLEPEIPKGIKNYMTVTGYNSLRKELSDLVTVERPEVVQVVSWAASNGDRSENGDYIYGKKRLREIDRRIRFLTKRLEIAEVIDPSQQPNKDRVYFGATVTYLNPNNDEVTVTIVGIDEADPLNGKISWISPVAKALIKSEEGQIVTLKTPNGKQEIEVLEIVYPD